MPFALLYRSFQSDSSVRKPPWTYQDSANLKWTIEGRTVLVMLSMWSFGSRRGCIIASYSNEVYKCRTRQLPSHAWSFVFFWNASKIFNRSVSPDRKRPSLADQVLLGLGLSHIVANVCMPKAVSKFQTLTTAREFKRLELLSYDWLMNKLKCS